MTDDVLLAKAAILERCVRRAREELAAASDFHSDYTRQDAAILNIERACEASIDMAMRLVRTLGLGAPASSREAFQALADAGALPADLALKLRAMVGFRNIATHQYQDLDIEIVIEVIERGLDDLLAFAKAALQR